jgi:hypothetical protein
MDVSVQFNPFALARLKRNLEATGKVVGLTTQWLVWDTARLAGNDAIKYTAPWADGTPGNSAKQKKVGEGAVDGDLRRIFAKADDRFVFFVNRGDGKRYAKSVETQKVFEVPDELWMPDIKTMHMRLRGRNGRVNRQKRQAFVMPAALKKYTASVQSRVGKLKASWLPATNYFAKKVNGKVASSAWINRHAGAGTHADNVRADGNGTAILSSTAPHNNAIRRSVIRFVQDQRDKFLMRVTPKRIEQIAAQFNRGMTPQLDKRVAA